ncbi:MAG: flagellar basal body L-ring protein FlgH [Syntrophobacterales bacterium]|jgi:flagellar L-ring protein precursor FlgH|nr:flagellar basal body L-ring protein FlgH [Syntrophobacterales bacterium]
MKKIIFIIQIMMLFCLVSCLPPREVVREDVHLPPPPERPVAHEGSIWRGETTQNSLFTDHRARSIGDLLTVVVAEASTGENKGLTDSKRNSVTNANISALLGMETTLLDRIPEMGGSIRMGGSSINQLKGEANTTRANHLSARITVRITKVLNNGNFMIEGRRQIRVNEEDQYIVLSGIIRPEDITSGNTISSQYISDAQIFYTGRGVVDDKLRPGWLTRVVDWVWPF